MKKDISNNQYYDPTPNPNRDRVWVGKIYFYIWDSDKTKERYRHDLSTFTFTCDACKERIHYESENMYGARDAKYIHFNELCKIAFVLQNI